MSGQVIQPEDWASPSGYANGILVEPGARLLFVAGQVAWDAQKNLVGEGDFKAQFAQALANVVAVVRAAGGESSDVARMLIMVTDKRAYLASLPELGAVWRATMGRHFPAMALVQVAGLIEEGALLEIEATAAIS
ncbi:MAG: RidA family protein [Planctomycetota bacterium]|nr:RidA family protein [Planctomycetota bacterium]